MSAIDLALTQSVAEQNRRTATTVGGNTSDFGFGNFDLSSLGGDLEGMMSQLMEYIQTLIPQLQSFLAGTPLAGMFNQVAAGSASAQGSAVTAEVTDGVNTRAADLRGSFAPAAGADADAADAGATVEAAEYTLSEHDAVGMYAAVVEDGQTTFTTSTGEEFELVHTASTDTGFDAYAMASADGTMVPLFKGMDLPTNATELAESMGDNPDMLALLEQGEGAEFIEDKEALVSLYGGDVEKYGMTITLDSQFSAQRGDFMAFMEDAREATEAKFGETPHRFHSVGHSMGTRFQAEAAITFDMKGTSIASAGIPDVLLDGGYPGAEGLDGNQLFAKINEMLFGVADGDDIVRGAIGRELGTDLEVDVSSMSARDADGKMQQIHGHGTGNAYLDKMGGGGAGGPAMS